MKDERADTGNKKKATKRATARSSKPKKVTPTTARRTAKSAGTAKKRPSARSAETVSGSTGTSSVRTRPAAPKPLPITEEQRRAMVAERAYFKAERRGFVGGDPVRDWQEAEAEVDALLLRGTEND